VHLDQAARTAGRARGLDDPGVPRAGRRPRRRRGCGPAPPPPRSRRPPPAPARRSPAGRTTVASPEDSSYPVKVTLPDCSTSAVSTEMSALPVFFARESSLARRRCSAISRRKPVLVHCQALLAGHFQGEVDREPVGVVQLEGLAAGQRRTAAPLDLADRRVEDRRPGAQRRGERRLPPRRSPRGSSPRRRTARGTCGAIAPIRGGGQLVQVALVLPRPGGTACLPRRRAARRTASAVLRMLRRRIPPQHVAARLVCWAAPRPRPA